MTQNDGGYDLTPPEKSPDPTPPSPDAASNSPTPKPGDPGFVPPVPIIEPPDSTDASTDVSVEYDPDLDPDIKQNKGMAILAYICFIIPLLIAPNSKFARYHANQGLLVFILWFVAIIGNVILYFVKVISNSLFAKIDALTAFFSCVVFLAQPALLLGVVALAVIGIIHASNGEKKPLPLFGQITLIK